MKIRTGFSQTRMAEILGVSQSTVSLWLHLKVKPTGLAKQALIRDFPGIYDQIEAAWKNKK